VSHAVPRGEIRQHLLARNGLFGGMIHDEIACHLGLLLPTVERRWRLARAWRYRLLGGVAA
jgi:ECF sigma factor